MYSLKGNRQDDWEYVHDESYISSWLHQFCRAVISICITRFGIRIGDRKYLNEYTPFGSASLWHVKSITQCQARRDQLGQPCITALNIWWNHEEIYNTSSCTYWQSCCPFLFKLCSQWWCHLWITWLKNPLKYHLNLSKGSWGQLWPHRSKMRYNFLIGWTFSFIFYLILTNTEAFWNTTLLFPSLPWYAS